MERLAGRTAIVTGGGSGIGKAAADLFVAEGAQVYLTDLNEAAERAAAEAIGEGARAVLHDLCDESGWQDVLESVVADTGRLDILVNNAGSALEGSPEDTTLETWRQVHAVNVEGVFMGCRAAIPPMRSGGGGSIVNIASRAAIGAAAPYLAAYGASKGAVRQYTRTVAVYCARAGYNIRCNSINPGAIDPPPCCKPVSTGATTRRRGAVPSSNEFRSAGSGARSILPMPRCSSRRTNPPS